MVEGVGLSALLAVTEKVKEWAGYRGKRRQLRYEEFVEPIHRALMDVHREYLEMFEECLSRMEKNDDFMAVVEQFKEARRKSEHVRRDLLAQVRVYRETLEERPFAEYFEAVEKYLAVPDPESDDARRANPRTQSLSYSTAALYQLLDEVDAQRRERILGTLNHESTPSFSAVGTVAVLLTSLKEQWNEVAAAHAKARAHTAP